MCITRIRDYSVGVYGKLPLSIFLFQSSKIQITYITELEENILEYLLLITVWQIDIEPYNKCADTAFTPNSGTRFFSTFLRHFPPLDINWHL
jgi:hypothetical protein